MKVIYYIFMILSILLLIGMGISAVLLIKGDLANLNVSHHARRFILCEWSAIFVVIFAQAFKPVNDEL